MKPRILMALVAALAVAAPMPISAQDEASPLTWVAYSLTKPGKTQDWVQLVVKNDAPVYDKLLADGTIISWGVATPINHRPGFKWNVLTWVTVPN